MSISRAAPRLWFDADGVTRPSSTIEIQLGLRPLQRLPHVPLLTILIASSRWDREHGGAPFERLGVREQTPAFDLGPGLARARQGLVVSRGPQPHRPEPKERLPLPPQDPSFLRLTPRWGPRLAPERVFSFHASLGSSGIFGKGEKELEPFPSVLDFGQFLDDVLQGLGI
ncbi:MAG: hypothetical protein CM15mP18_0100 [Methanobacteriota archaeon]|nr:MAG: hypothetical protein CM15mP18_0100 [Euryarchaeota archaeon]